LVEVTWAKSSVDNALGEHETDGIKVGGYPLLPGSVGTNGYYDEYAVIVRVAPRGTSNNPHFIVAGRTADGTAVASNFLVTNWAKLAKLYPRKKSMENADAVFVIRFKAKAGAPSTDSDRKGQLVMETDAKEQKLPLFRVPV
jgi:hypothetical protein